jgi:4-guanidinobutyraldehyde dehydrogenase / NAD-dependent aldehyde dehydrogenase
MTTTAEPSTWEARAAELDVNGQAIIAGRYVDAKSGKTFEKRSPVDGRVLGTVAEGDAAEVEAAVAAARKAYEDGVWSELAPRQRKTILLEYAQRILDEKEELTPRGSSTRRRSLRSSRRSRWASRSATRSPRSS